MSNISETIDLTGEAPPVSKRARLLVVQHEGDEAQAEQENEKEDSDSKSNSKSNNNNSTFRADGITSIKNIFQRHECDPPAPSVSPLIVDLQQGEADPSKIAERQKLIAQMTELETEQSNEVSPFREAFEKKKAKLKEETETQIAGWKRNYEAQVAEAREKLRKSINEEHDEFASHADEIKKKRKSSIQSIEIEIEELTEDLGIHTCEYCYEEFRETDEGVEVEDDCKCAKCACLTECSVCNNNMEQKTMQECGSCSEACCTKCLETNGCIECGKRICERCFESNDAESDLITCTSCKMKGIWKSAILSSARLCSVENATSVD